MQHLVTQHLLEIWILGGGGVGTPSGSIPPADQHSGNWKAIEGKGEGGLGPNQQETEH